MRIRERLGVPSDTTLLDRCGCGTSSCSSLHPGCSHDTASCRDVEADALSEETNRFRKTKLVCTIGPTSCKKDDLYALADQVGLMPSCGSSNSALLDSGPGCVLVACSCVFSMLLLAPLQQAETGQRQDGLMSGL